MKWVEISVDAPPEFVEPLSEIFHRYGHGGVAVEQNSGHSPDEGDAEPAPQMVTLRTYVPFELSTDELFGRIDVGTRLVALLAPISSLRKRVLEEENWQSAWKKHFKVLHIGRHIVIVPTWHEYEPNEHEVIAALDPGMAFGTGHHPTTRMCLELLEDLVAPDTDVLDVGCGSGILSIVAAKLGARSVSSLDIDPLAAKAAASNAGENRVEKIVTVLEGSLPHSEIRSGHYDVAVANISHKVVSELADHLVASLKPGGHVVASGLLTKDRNAVIERFEGEGAYVTRTEQADDWVGLVARKGPLS